MNKYMKIAKELANDNLKTNEKREIGGLGIFIVKQMTEKMEYKYNKKNTLILTIALN